MTSPEPDPNRRVAQERVVVQDVETTGNALRIFQLVTAAVGAALFVLGLLAVFQVDFGVGWLKLSGEVADLAFSPAVAIGCIVLGAALLGATLSDQDRSGAALVSFLVLAAGIAGMVIDDDPTADIQVDPSTATVLIVLGAIGFVCSMIPWWSGRSVRTTRYG